MGDRIVLLHGSANGSFSWTAVRAGLSGRGLDGFAPDMMGYGRAPAPSDAYDLDEEVRHLVRRIDGEGIDRLHLIAHSLGSMYALHLRLALAARVTRLTLIDPVLVSVLRETGETAGYAEMEAQYQRFMGAPDHAAAARTFVNHWSGAGAWEAIGDRARAVITSLAPRLRLEMDVTRNSSTPLSVLAAASPPTEILVGERTLEAPRAASRQLARAFGAKVTVVPGAAHMLPLTHPQAIVEAITR